MSMSEPELPIEVQTPLEQVASPGPEEVSSGAEASSGSAFQGLEVPHTQASRERQLTAIGRKPDCSCKEDDEFHKAHHMRFNLGHVTAFSHAVAHLKHKKKPHENHPKDRQTLDAKDLACVILLCTTYVTLIFCRNFANPLAPALASDSWGYDNSKHTSALVCNGVAYGVGKIINGVAVNAFNPRVCLFTFIIGSAGMVFLFSFLKGFISDSEGRYSLLVFFWAVNSFIQSGADSAFTKYTYERFRPEQYATVFSFICLGSRLGAVAASLCLGALLSTFEWPDVAKLASLITLCGVATLSGTFMPFSDKPHAMPHDREAHALQAKKIKNVAVDGGKTGCALYATWWQNPRFLFMAASTGCLGALSVVDAILGLYIGQVFNPALTVAAMMCACLPAGIVISIPLFGFIVPKLKTHGQMKFIMTMVGILVLAMTGLTLLTGTVEGHHPDSSLAGVAGVLIFLYGLMLGFPYYVPPAVFALDFGHASGGMVATFIDLVSALLSAALSFAVGALSGIGWVYVWGLLLILACTAFVTLFYWHILNLRWIAAGRPSAM